MAGIEPASERFNPRISTCLESLGFHRGPEVRQNRSQTIRSGPKALFRILRGKECGTLTL